MKFLDVYFYRHGFYYKELLYLYGVSENKGITRGL